MKGGRVSRNGVGNSRGRSTICEGLVWRKGPSPEPMRGAGLDDERGGGPINVRGINMDAGHGHSSGSCDIDCNSPFDCIPDVGLDGRWPSVAHGRSPRPADPTESWWADYSDAG